MDVGLFFLLLLEAYTVATLIGIAHTCFNWLVLKDKIETMYDITAYAKTVPFHPLYDITICPIFSYSYFHIAKVPLNEARGVALLLGVI